MAEGGRLALEVQERSGRGSRAARRLRRAGFVPGIVYGGGSEPEAFQVQALELWRVLHGHSPVLDLKIGGGPTRPVIVKDQQRHPVRDELVHIDLLQVDLSEKIQTTVAVELAGAEEAPGAKEGGVVEHVTRELNIEAVPGDLPERIVVDVSGMEPAATMHLSELSPPPRVEFLDDPEETIIATVTMPSEIDAPEEIEEETELVGAEAGARGATGDEADAEAADSEGEGEDGDRS